MPNAHAPGVHRRSTDAVPSKRDETARFARILGALLVLAGTLAVRSQATLAAFDATTSNDQGPFSTKRIYSAERSWTAQLVGDAAAGGAAVDGRNPVASADGVKWRTGAFSSTASASRYVEFALDGFLPDGLTAGSGVTANVAVASAAGSNACYWLEVRRASSDAVLGTFGSSGAPVGCSTGTTASSTITDVTSAVGTSALANDVKIRVLGTEAGNKQWDVDAVNLTFPVYGKSLTLYPESGTDSSTGTPAATAWGPATLDASPYVTAGNWNNNYAANRYLDFTFPTVAPNGVTPTAVSLDHAYKSDNVADTTCWYAEVYSGATLLGTHGSSGSPISCNGGASYVTDTVSLPEVNTGAKLNGLTVRVYATVNGKRKTDHDLVVLRATYNLAATGCVDPSTTTITSTGDNWIQQDGAGANTNRGTDVSMDVKSQSTKLRRGMIQFGSIPAPAAECTLTGAQLRVYVNTFGGTRGLSAFTINDAWGELTATWNAQPAFGGTPASATASAVGWVTFDVTAQVQAMQAAGVSNGFMVTDADETTGTNVTNKIDTREGANPPQLVLTVA
jgi:hypothetical protein